MQHIEHLYNQLKIFFPFKLYCDFEDFRFHQILLKADNLRHTNLLLLRFKTKQAIN